MNEITNHQIPRSKQSPNTKPTSAKHAFDLEDRTLAFAKNVIQLCRAVKHDVVSREIVSQLVRASGSVGANYREANDALSKRDFGHRIRIARREAKETYYWLQLLAHALPELNGQTTLLLQEAQELKLILSSIAQKTS